MYLHVLILIYRITFLYILNPPTENLSQSNMKKVSSSQVQRVTVTVKYTQQTRRITSTTNTIKRRQTRFRVGNNWRNTLG